MRTEKTKWTAASTMAAIALVLATAALAASIAAATDDDAASPMSNGQSMPMGDSSMPMGGGMSAEDMEHMKPLSIRGITDAPSDRGGTALAGVRRDGALEFQLDARPVWWRIGEEQRLAAWAYNGIVPGPVIRVSNGERVRIRFTNRLPEPTSVHWHGIGVPNAMDGVPDVTQKPIAPGKSFTYEFVAKPAGTHMYHSHHNSTEQVGKGLLGPFIVEPKDPSTRPAFDREYTLVLNDGELGFSINGKGFPATQPLVAKQGERVLVRFMNEGTMIHPMHLHGMPMQVVAKDGWLQQPWLCDTLNIAPGDRWEVIVHATELGTWAFHCHILPHAESTHGMLGMVTALVVQ